MLSFETGSAELSTRVVESLKLFGITVSFGGVASSIGLPARMSHASIPAAARRSRRLPEDLVRVSIGIEHVDDLIADLSQALSASSSSVPQQQEVTPCPQLA
jgi:cystathionine beta-lyase